MCGRFTQAYAWAEVHAFLDVIGPGHSWVYTKARRAEPGQVGSTLLEEVKGYPIMLFGELPGRVQVDARVAPSATKEPPCKDRDRVLMTPTSQAA
jgi:hypothetical protein